MMLGTMTTGLGENNNAEVAVDNDDDDDSQSQHMLHRLVNNVWAMEAEDELDVQAVMDAEETTGLRENNNGEGVEAAINAYATLITSALNRNSLVDTGHTKGTYAHHQRGQVKNLVHELIEHTVLNNKFRFIDIGAGLNQPALFASLISGCRAFGGGNTVIY